MLLSTVKGRCILIVEDEPLIAMDIAHVFERAGARVTTAGTLRQALPMVEADGLSAAIVDHALSDGDSSGLYERLEERDIPFVMYSGYGERKRSRHASPHVSKPASPEVLLAIIEGMLGAGKVQS